MKAYNVPAKIDTMRKKHGAFSDKSLIIIPCYNESASIVNLLSACKRLGVGYDTLAIDDGSSDDTYNVARMHSPCMRWEKNIGIGKTMQFGMQYALAQEYDLCIRIDGDNQHHPDEIRKLREAYQRSGYGFIIGSRYLQGVFHEKKGLRQWGSWSVSAWIWLLFGRRWIADPTSGMRLMDAATMRFFSGRNGGKYPEAVSLAQAIRHGMAFEEVGIGHSVRNDGKSSLSGLRALRAWVEIMLRILVARLA